MHQSIPAAPSVRVRVRVKSLLMAPGLAHARPLGSAKFANAPPPGWGGGGGAQLELTDALQYWKSFLTPYFKCKISLHYHNPDKFNHLTLISNIRFDKDSNSWNHLLRLRDRWLEKIFQWWSLVLQLYGHPHVFGATPFPKP